MSSRPKPPAPLRRLMAASLPRERRAELLEEMDTLYESRVARSGRGRAVRWYLRHALGFWRVRVADGARALLAAPVLALGTVLRDLRQSARALLRRPSYALTSTLTLGVGLGGLVAVAALANWLLLRPVPGVPRADELTTFRLEIHDESPSWAFPVSEPDRRSLLEEMPILTALEGSAEREANVLWTEGSPADRRTASAVTPGWFELLGLQPSAGRLPRADFATTDRHLLVSHRVASERLGGPAAALGRTIRLNGHAWTVVGVAPRGFRGPELPGSTDLWIPGAFLPDLQPRLPADFAERRDRTVWSSFVGRLRPGVEPDAVAAASTAAMSRIRDRHAPPNSFVARFELRAFPGLGLSPWFRDEVARTLRVLLFGASGLLLLALANVANLSLTRSVGSQSETAVHIALGGSRLRVLLRGLSENVLIGASGALVGLAVAQGTLALFRDGRLSTRGAPLAGVQLDGRVIVFASLVALAVSVAAGLLPRLWATRLDPGRAMRGRRTRSRGILRVQNGLVVTQVALSTLLLLGSGLLLRTTGRIAATDIGFDPDQAVRFAIDPAAEGHDRAGITAVVERMETRLRESPGVSEVGFVWPAPVSGSYLTFAVEPATGGDRVTAALYSATEGLLPALGARLLAGRFHLPSERASMGTSEEAAPVRPAVVSLSLVEAALGPIPPAAAIDRELLAPGGSDVRVRIVGVVEDLRLRSLTDESPPVVVLPWGYGFIDDVTGWIRTNGDAARIAAGLPAAVSEIEPGLPVFDTRTGREQVETRVADRIVMARLAGVVALLGAALAAIGLYGLLSYLVLDRRREIGIRIALGAPIDRVRHLVTGRALGLTLVGIALGGIAAVPALGLIRSRLHEVAPSDPVTWGGVLVLLLGVGALSAAIPAWRSTRVDPRVALTAE